MDSTQQDVLLSITDPMPTSGKISGFVKIPYSSNRSAYGFLPLPFAVLGKEGGPTVLLMAGSHGDECEAQIAATRIVSELDVSTMTGRLIALPMANAPAARDAQRNSPIDGLNLNRAFPGDIFGSPTEVIANYIERQLMPHCDIVIDLHGASESFDYLPCVTVIHHPDAEERLRRTSAALAFGAPMLVFFHSYQERNSSGAAKRAGAIRIGTETGGPGSVEMMIDGVRNLLAWAGITPSVEGASRPALPDIRVVHPDPHYLYATTDGLFEPAVRLGDHVASGDLAGYIHDPSRPLAPPGKVTFTTAGQVICAKPLGRTSRGDCLLHLAQEADAELMTEIEEAASCNWLNAAVPTRRVRKRAARARPRHLPT